MRYNFVERDRGRRPIRLMCRVLRVSPGGYYDWQGKVKELGRVIAILRLVRRPFEGEAATAERLCHNDLRFLLIVDRQPPRQPS